MKQILAYEENPSKRDESRWWCKEGFAKKSMNFADIDVSFLPEQKYKWQLNQYTAVFEITAGNWHLPVKCIKRPDIFI